jgi:chromosome partitioning protein
MFTMKTLTFSLGKGGTFKTSSALSVAACMAEEGRRVLLVDLDPQHSLTSWLRAELDGADLHGALVGGADPGALIRRTSTPGMDIIPGGVTVSRAEKELAGEIGGELALRRLLDRIPAGYDYAIVDPPPALGSLSINALAAANIVYIPVECSALALGALTSWLEVIGKVRAALNPSLVVGGLLPVRFQIRTTLSRETLESLQATYPDVLEPIPQSAKAAEAPLSGQPITAYDRSGSVAIAYRRLTHQILEADNEKT